MAVRTSSKHRSDRCLLIVAKRRSVSQTSPHHTQREAKEGKMRNKTKQTKQNKTHPFLAWKLTHTHTHTLSLSLSLCVSLSHDLSLDLSHDLSLPAPLSLKSSLSHTHTHTRALPLPPYSTSFTHTECLLSAVLLMRCETLLTDTCGWCA